MKFIFSSTLILALCVSAAGQQKSTRDIPKNKNFQTITEAISGQWKLNRIADSEKKGVDGDNGSSVNDNQATNGMQIIEFRDNSRYKMNNATTAVDSGSYIVNEQNKSVMLESDLAGNESSEWNVLVKKNELTLVPAEDAEKRYAYVYTRTRSGKKK